MKLYREQNALLLYLSIIRHLKSIQDNGYSCFNKFGYFSYFEIVYSCIFSILQFFESYKLGIRIILQHNERTNRRLFFRISNSGPNQYSASRKYPYDQNYQYTYQTFSKLPIKYKDEIITRILYQFKGLPETGLNDMPFARVYKSISFERGIKKNP